MSARQYRPAFGPGRGVSRRSSGRWLCCRVRLVRDQRLKAVLAPRAQYDARALCGKEPGGCFTKSATSTRDNDDFSFDVISHGFIPFAFVVIGCLPVASCLFLLKDT